MTTAVFDRPSKHDERFTDRATKAKCWLLIFISARRVRSYVQLPAGQGKAGAGVQQPELGELAAQENEWAMDKWVVKASASLAPPFWFGRLMDGVEEACGGIGGTVSVCLARRLGVGRGGRKREDTIVMFCSPPLSFFHMFFVHHGLIERDTMVWSGLVLVVWSGSSFFLFFVVGFVLMKRKKEMEQSENLAWRAGKQAGRHGMEAGRQGKARKTKERQKDACPYSCRDPFPIRIHTPDAVSKRTSCFDVQGYKECFGLAVLGDMYKHPPSNGST